MEVCFGDGLKRLATSKNCCQKWRNKLAPVCTIKCRCFDILGKRSSKGWSQCMMTSQNGNIFRVTGPLCVEFTGHRWIPLTKGQSLGAFIFCLICVWINGCVNNRETGDLRRHRAHYVTEMEARTLQWRYNLRYGVSNHWRLDSLLNQMCSAADHRKHKSAASLSFVRRIPPWPLNSLTKGQ